MHRSMQFGAAYAGRMLSFRRRHACCGVAAGSKGAMCTVVSCLHCSAGQGHTHNILPSACWAATVLYSSVIICTPAVRVRVIYGVQVLCTGLVIYRSIAL
jgi:hypothetical protein